jgi:hypothetical protein
LKNASIYAVERTVEPRRNTQIEAEKERIERLY